MAHELAQRLARVQALPADHPDASIAAFANPAMAERMNAMIDGALQTPGAVDLTEQIRGTPRLVKVGRVAWLLPTIIRCDREHPLANKEFLFPFAAVVKISPEEMSRMPEPLGKTLVVSALSQNRELIDRLLLSPMVDRLNVGPIATNVISWDQPHEGNLFEHLYARRSFQAAVAL
jgi:acyl-CoA reductase-like NAD-dependent aldehyde dehydrogenase